MPRFTLMAAAAAAALGVQMPAHATASSSASLTDFSWTLIDLNTADGIAPTLTFAGQSYVYTYTYNSSLGTTDSHDAAGTSVMDPISSSSSDGHSVSSAAITATSLSTSGHTSGSSTGGQYGYYQGTAYLNNYYSSSFTLSPFTAVIFQGTATTAATTTAPYDGLHPEWAYGDVQINGSLSYGNNNQSASASFSAYSDNTSGTFYAESGPLALSFINPTGNAVNGSLYGAVQSYGYSYAAAVPEPETYAMLLAGLAVVGTLSRRRQRR